MTGASGGAEGETWVHSWTAMPQAATPQDLPPAPFAQQGALAPGTTLRQTVHVSVGGRRIRVRLSNAFGPGPVTVAAAAVALPAQGAAGVSAVVPGTSRPVTFGGRRQVVLPPGAPMVSDPVDLAVPAQANLTITVQVSASAPGGLTCHPGSRTTSYLVSTDVSGGVSGGVSGDASGDATEAPDLPGAVAVEHWYLLGGVEVLAPGRTRALVVLGDSLSDGRGSTTDGNDRWPDLLLARLQAGGHRHLAVCNQAGGGNRVLDDGVGPGALARLDRDVLALGGVSHLVVLEGVNDLGTAAATAAAQRGVAADLVRAYEQLVLRARAHGIRVHGATLLPFGGHADYDDVAGHRDGARREVNAWIRTSGCFDGVLDLDRAARDPDRPRRLRATYDGGDHLHLGPAGYAALAAAVPLDLFG